jgi:hypothetical protein
MTWATTPIRRPRRVWYDIEDKVTLDILGEGAQPYVLRGGICWPYARLGGLACEGPGYAVVIGRDNHGRITVFEYCDVESVKTRLGPDGVPVQYGIGVWLVENWARYLCRRYYYCQTDVLPADFLRDVWREATIEPKPYFMETRERIESDAAITVLRAQGELRATQEFLERLDGAAGRMGILDPCKHALACALAGLKAVKR